MSCCKAQKPRSAPMALSFNGEPTKWAGSFRICSIFRAWRPGNCLEKSRQAVSLIVKKVMEVFEFKAQQKSLRLESQFAAKDELEAECDPYRVHQVLANLIDNAIKFTPAGGAIIVSVAPGAGEVCFSVAD